MKRALIFLLIILPVYLFVSLYFLDKAYFLCPVRCIRDMVIRSDGLGDGFFAAGRSGNRVHEGIDLLAATGATVFASRSGVVIRARQNNGMGKFVKIMHAGGITTTYGHLSQIFVSENQFVRQGEVIGSVGKTGNASSRLILSHLHFEVRKDNLPLDPLEYLE